MDNASALTAPALFGMHSRGAKVLAALLVGALAISATANREGVSSFLLLILSLAAVSVGIAVMVSVPTDPMSRLIAWPIAATGPISCLLTCLAITGSAGNPNQLNMFSAGVVICSFLGVRGRIAAAWWAFLTMAAVLGYWSVQSNQPLSWVLLVAPNAAVLGMATLVRPAATIIRRLRAEGIDQASQMAATEARIAERDRQRAELRRLAWPTLQRIGQGKRLSAEEVAEVRLIEAQLRDYVRAPSLSTPTIARAAREARSRGVNVAMFDDGGMDACDHGVMRTEFHTEVADRLGDMTDGTVTVRIHPPDRAILGSIVMLRNDGTSQRIDVKP